METKQNVILAPYTTFHIGGPAKYFLATADIEEVKRGIIFAKERNLPLYLLGGGSNVLISDNGFDGLVINYNPRGISMSDEDNTTAKLTIASGEPWDDVVQFAVDRDLWGIENLSHIPGWTGGVPVQNVGAYGQEASQVIERVDAYNINKGEIESFTNSQCAFGYRSSIFNGEKRGQYIIISVTLTLSKTPAPNISYGDVQRYFNDKGVATPNLKDIRQAITEIRDQKFPYPTDPSKGSAGSFFKAPTVSEKDFEILLGKIESSFGLESKNTLSAMKNRLTVTQGVKIPYGFLIELCGLKGYAIGGAGICQTHAGVIQNLSGNATSSDVINLFKYVRDLVHQKTGITLENEPELVGFTTEELA